MLIIKIPDEQQERLESLAHENGYESATEYVLALIEAAEEANDLIDDPEEAAVDLEAEFREAWRAAMTGEGLEDARDIVNEIRREMAQDGK